MIKLLNPNILMVIYSVLVAGSFRVGHSITMYMDSSLLIFIRFLLASILFGAYVGMKYGIKRPCLNDLLRYFTISSTLVFYFLGMFEALKYTTALNTGIIYTLVPMFSTISGYIILKEKSSLKKIAVLSLAMCGALWVISGGSIKNILLLNLGRGDIIFFFACISMGLFSPFSKWLDRGEETAVMTFWTLFTGTILLLFIANKRILDYNWRDFPIELGAGLFYIVVFTTIITFFIVQYSSKKLPVSKVMSYIYLIPVFIAGSGFLFKEGFPQPIVIPGIAIAALCTFLYQRG